MQAQRLLDNLQAQQQKKLDEFFGSPRLLDDRHSVEPIASVKKVAVLTESFLPKVDGVAKTSYLTIRYLQETGREVLVFAPDIAVDRVGDSQVIPLPSIGLPQAPETRMALPNPIVARHIEDFQPDLIHLFSPAAMSVNGMAMGRHLNLAVIANYQTDLPGYTEHYGFPLLSGPVNRWLRYIHNGCHLTLAPTHTIIHQLREVGYRRVRHWGRGVNTERFNPCHVRPANAAAFAERSRSRDRYFAFLSGGWPTKSGSTCFWIWRARPVSPCRLSVMAPYAKNLSIYSPALIPSLPVT